MYAGGGNKIARYIPGSEQTSNLVLLHSKIDHDYMMREIKRGIKKMTVLGVNMESLELVSTIRREYPKIHITVIDENRETYLDVQFGKDVSNSLIQ